MRSFKLTDLRNMREVMPSGRKLTYLCQWLLDRSINIGDLLFYRAILLIMEKAPSLSNG